ncbi:MAG: tetratricopeptide repeat protein, partial [Bacteroidota bacterium]
CLFFEEGVTWADLFDEGVAWAQKQLNIAQDYYGGKAHQDIAKALQNVGISYMHIGNLKAALKYHNQALAMQKSIQRNQGSDTDISDYYNKVGVILWKSGKSKEALPYFEKALEEKKRLSQDIKNEDTALYLHHKGRVLDHLGRYHEALRAFETALGIRRHIHSSQEHVRLAEALNEVGTAFIKLKRAKQLPKECEESFSMYNRLLQGQENKWMTVALNNMGTAFSLLGKYIEALPYYRRAVIMSFRIHRKEHYLLTDHLKNLVNTLGELADTVLIQQAQQEILPLCIQYLGKDHELTKALSAVGGNEEQENP